MANFADKETEEADEWVRNFSEREVMQPFFGVDNEALVAVTRSRISFGADVNAQEHCGGDWSMYTFRRKGPMMMWTATFTDDPNLFLLLAPEGM